MSGSDRYVRNTVNTRRNCRCDCRWNGCSDAPFNACW